MFVAESDFDEIPYNLPVSEDAPNALSDLILFKEKEILRKLLGSATYNDFVNALFVNPNADPLVPIDESLIAQKWKDLRDGADYEIGNKTYRYDGVKNFLKPFICAEWFDQNAENATSLGTSEPVMENSISVSPAIRISEYWNEFADLVGSCADELDTLYGFMSFRYEEDFPDWTFEDPGLKNEFDL